MKTTTRILSFILILATLAACTPAPTAAPTATATPAPTATITLTPTVTPSPTPTLTPTPAAPEVGSEMQAYLDSFEAYQMLEVDGIWVITVTHYSQEYKVMVEEDGVWVRSYDDMAKFVHADGTFDMETAKEVLSFGLNESKDDINTDDYRRYTEAVVKIFDGLDPAGLKAAEVSYHRSGISTTLTGEKELEIYVNGSSPQIIGVACQEKLCLATIAVQGGPITIVFTRNGGVGFIGGSVYLESEEQTLLTLASGRKLDYVAMSILLSTEAMNPDGDFTIKNLDNQTMLRQLAMRLDFSFEDLEAIHGDSFHWVDSKYLELVKTLSSLGRPLPIYDIDIAGLQAD